ncbi:MAG: MmcQ/YjbR family DNA-binding protein [Actinoallomurus sp.]
MITVDDIRRLTSTLPRSEEHLIRDRVKFRIGSIVYVAISRDETTMGCGFPKEEREAMIAAEPDKFFMPRVSDQRFNWIEAHMSALTEQEMHELVLDAWRMAVPKRVAAAHAALSAAEGG